jgi:hypothetical protein
MTNSYVLDINGNGGAIIKVLAKRLCYRYRVTESLLKADGTTLVTPQGLVITDLTGTNRVPAITQATIMLPAPTTTNAPADFPYLEMPNADDAQFHAAYGQPIARGPDTPGAGMPSLLAQPLFSVRSATATATSIRVEEMGS